MEDSLDSSGKHGGVSAPATKDSKWTDEKHCLFLDSMESTFVNQLFKSIGKHSWHSHKKCSIGSKSSNNRLADIRSSPDQFKAIRGSCISKLGLRIDKPEVDQEEESKVSITATPWIRCYTTSRTQPKRTPLEPNDDFQDSTDSNAEVTDQNFNDEEEPCRMRDAKGYRIGQCDRSLFEVVPSKQ